MADNVQMQGIEFQIVGETKDASEGIKALSRSIKSLQRATSKGLGLSAIVSEIKNLNTAIGDSNFTNLTTMANALFNIGLSSRKLTSVASRLEKISQLDFSNLTGAANAIGAITETAGWRRRASSATEPTDTNLPSDTPGGDVEGAADSAEQLADAEEEATDRGRVLRQMLVDLAKEFKSGAVGALRFGKNLIALPFKRLAASIKSTIAPIKQFLNSIARIAMYRAIRGIIGGITQALQEGMKNLYQYSIMAGTSFHSAMDAMATDALWLKNSFAAAVAPIFEALMPALDALAAKIVTVLNLLAQLMAILGGKSTYTKAVKSATKFGEATGSAAKEVRMLISGFDELNAFQDKSGGGGGGADFGSMFEEADVDAGVSEFGKQLREAFKHGEWEELGSLLGNKFNEVFSSIYWEGIGIELGKKLDGVIRTAYSFLKTVDFKAIGAGFADLINGAISVIDFETAGRLFIRNFTLMVDTIIGFIQTLDWGSVAKAIGDFFMGAFREASEWLHANDFGEIARTLSDGIKKILDAILLAVREMDWFAVGKAIGDFLGNIDWFGIFTRVAEIVWTAFSGVLTGLLSTNGGRIFVALFAAIQGLNLAFTLASPLLAAAVQRWILTGVNPLSTMPQTISQIGASILSTLGVIAKGVALGALAVFDGVMIAYDAKSLIEAGRTYNEAQNAHNRETESALNTYARLYKDKGKEVADEWAQMVYKIDTTNMDFDSAQKALTEKIEGYWDGVPQNMWEGFTQGWNTYFGEDGSGLFGLLGDAFNGAIDGVKGLLGIASPSTVFFDMGVDLVDGLFNGIKSVWDKVSNFFTQSFTALKTLTTQTWTTIKTLTSQTWTNIKTTITNLFTQTKTTIVTTLNNIKTNITTAWNSAKTTTTTAWTNMCSTARTKFTEIKNTVTNSMNQATSYLKGLSWTSIGSNLVNGLLNGLKSAWHSVTSWASSAASALTNTLSRAFDIGSPSREWAKIGNYLDLGLQQGLEQGTGNLIATTTQIADAMSNAIIPTIPSPAVMTSYGVSTPSIATGYESYGEDDGSVSGIATVLEQMYEYMRSNQDSGDVKVIIDGREVFNAVVNENNRAIQRTGVSPIRV